MRTPEELRAFVQKKLRRGYPQGELVNELLQEGYAADEIDKAIYLAGKNEEKPGPVGNNPVWFVLTTGLGIVGISLLSVSYFANFRPVGYTLILIGATGIFIKFLLPFLEKSTKKDLQE